MKSFFSTLWVGAAVRWSRGFAISGAGKYYLASNSRFLHQGSSDISPALAAGLLQRTTSVPVEKAPQTISSDTVWDSAANPGSGLPDLGFHYSRLNFLVRNVAVSGATLRLQDGVSVGVISGTGETGIRLQGGARLISEGTPRYLNRIIRYNAVQEQRLPDPSWGLLTGIGGLIATDLQALSGEAQLKFTMLAGQHNLFDSEGLASVSFRDCQFFGGWMRLSGYYPSIGSWDAKNCLFSRVIFDPIFISISAELGNNTFFRGQMSLDLMGNSSFFVNNLFDYTAVGDTGGDVFRFANAYMDGWVWGVPDPIDDVVLQEDFEYASGPLGDFYHASTDLVDRGASDAGYWGLQNHTTQISGTREGSSQVDIGFHYAADNDGDGLDDIWELQHGLSPDIASDLHGAGADLDGDGLTNLEEYQQGTSPVRPNGLTSGGGYARLPMPPAMAAKAYDVYYRPDVSSNWRRISSASAGQKVLTFVNPNPASEGDYVLLHAADDDGDGLSNGYENWFTYAGQRTDPTRVDSDIDTMYDGWEVRYGLNPKSTAPPNGGADDPDADLLSNAAEHTGYGYVAKQFNATYDPLNTQPSRPVITISQSQASAFNLATFTITRDVRGGGSLGAALPVYFAVGGDLVYKRDYTLLLSQGSTLSDESQPFSVTIPANEASTEITVAVTPGPTPTSSLTVTLVPHASAQ